MPKNVSTGNALTCLKSREIEKTIEDSIQYIQIILKEAEENISALYKEETYRVIVLYIISIIEAILLRVIELRKEKIVTIEYKHVSPINKDIKHSDFPDMPVIIAIQEKTDKENSRIGFKELIDFIKSKKLMGEKISREILDISNVRNTFHFTKPRNKITCEIKTVEKAFDLLVKIIEGAPGAISYKK